MITENIIKRIDRNQKFGFKLQPEPNFQCQSTRTKCWTQNETRQIPRVCLEASKIKLGNGEATLGKTELVDKLFPVDNSVKIFKTQVTSTSALKSLADFILSYTLKLIIIKSTLKTQQLVCFLSLYGICLRFGLGVSVISFSLDLVFVRT